ncbi:hypothetical protein FPOA_09430 [Fusarium poae]|uniref:Uncharacterized protein n=1 Tax=Fusarium poae TaxID=36050 RepID=A0A1B8AB45_FUSPO|nr:hypothetical protein FPOA_09430 [Fusarium poae]
MVAWLAKQRCAPPPPPPPPLLPPTHTLARSWFLGYQPRTVGLAADLVFTPILNGPGHMTDSPEDEFTGKWRLTNLCDRSRVAVCRSRVFENAALVFWTTTKANVR